MAPSKRKRISTRTSKSNKRPKYADSSDGKQNAGILWGVECILDERKDKGKPRYLVKWTDIDPETKRVYTPEWVAEQDVTEALLVSWIKDKARKAAGSSSGGAANSAKRRLQKTQQQAQQAQQLPRRNRRARVIESSPEPSTTAHSSTRQSSPPTPARDSLAPAGPSSNITTPIAQPDSTRASPCIQITRRGSSLEREEFHRFSQLAASQDSSAQPQTQGNDLDSSQLFAAARAFSSGIVPDSQSSAGEESFVPPTQQTENTNPQSTAPDSSQQEEDVKEYSGLLDIIQQAAPLVISPTRSIPETVLDTNADSQSQSQRHRIVDLIEIPDTLESGHTSSQPVPTATEEEEAHTDNGDQHLVSRSEGHAAQNEPGTQQQSDLPKSAEGASQPAQESTPQFFEDPTNVQQLDESGAQEEPSAQGFLFGASLAVTYTAEPEVQVASDPQSAIHRCEDIQVEQSNEQPGLSSDLDQDRSASGRVTVIPFPTQQPDLGEGRVDQTARPEEEEAAYFPLHYQQSIHQIAAAQQNSAPLLPEPNESGSRKSVDVGLGNLTLSLVETHVHASAESTKVIPESPHGAPQQSTQTRLEQSIHIQAHDDELLNEFLESEYTRCLTPVLDQHQQLQLQLGLQDRANENTTQSIHASPSNIEAIIQRSDLASYTQALVSATQSTPSHEQNAQVVHFVADLSTQEDITDTIRPTIEEEYGPHRASSESRHDSSQESPERYFSSLGKAFTQIAHPLSQSIGSHDSKGPSRPCTPAPNSSSSKMASHDTAEEVARQLAASLAKRQAENPFTPSRRMIRSSITPSVKDSEAPVSSPAPARNLLGVNASPSRAGAEGTRSPSTVPDQSPASRVPTSLRTVAIVPPSSITVDTLPEHEAVFTTSVRPELAEPNVIVPVDEPSTLEGAPPAAAPMGEGFSDADVEVDIDIDEGDSDSDNQSVLNDDLELEGEEYVVPLSMEGRQLNMYTEYIKENKDLLDQFLADPSGFTPFAQVKNILSYLGAVETHVDLIYAEAQNVAPSSQTSPLEISRHVGFGVDNSVKFNFLHYLFHHLRNLKKHLVLVTAHDNEALLDVLELFCIAKLINYNMPTRTRQANPAHVEGTLTVTILSSNASPIMRPPNLIVCLDGFQEASQIRKKNWARSFNLDTVPVIHLVIPRTVGHIERYISPTLGESERTHTILASLAQVRDDIGRPIDELTPRAPQCAAQVAEWLKSGDDDEDNDNDGYPWPLPSIGSVKDIIEFQTQVSQTSVAPVAPERTKRPLDNQDLDPSKRMRFTPQPRTVSSSSLANDNDITHIINSIPNTAVDETSLRRRLAQKEEAFEEERKARKIEEHRFAEHEGMWDKQQTVHENLTREHRLLLGQQKSTKEQLENATKTNETLRERLNTRTTELRQATDKLNEQRATHLLSEDQKIVEITRLRKELAAAHDEKARALKTARSADQMAEYSKEQYRNASDAATSSQSLVSELQSQNAKLMLQASGEPAKLKALHLDRQWELQERQVKSLRNENSVLKRTLGQKEDELSRARNYVGRAGVGTRAQSVTPQPPKVRSRAASPMGGRLSNLRNG